jgi:hypothetical protein
MAHTPLKMTIDEAHAEVCIGWANSYSAKAIEGAGDSLDHEPLGYRINILMARLFSGALCLRLIVSAGWRLRGRRQFCT